MRYTPAATVVAALAAQAAATAWDVSAKGYSCPSNTDNQCSSSQQGGYDWSSLSPGSFSSYGSNSFSGFNCTSASNQKRNVLSERGFQSKCIAGSLDDKPSMSCSGGEDQMSIDHYHISSSEDTSVDCQYSMPDGSTCTETHACSAEGSIVQNSQCGGAQGVTFKPAGGSSPGCTMSIHSIGFNCGSASSSAPVATPTPSASVSISRPATTTSDTSASSSTVAITSDVYSTSGSSSSASSVETSPVTASSTPSPTSTYPAYNITSSYSRATVPTIPAYGGSNSSTSVSTVMVPAYGTISAETSTATSPASVSVSIASYSTSTIYSTSQSTTVSSGSTVIVTATIAISTTICPVTATETGSASTSVSGSVVSPVSNSTITPASYSVPSSSSATANTYPTPDTPGLLPSCLNTWLYETGCTDNTDSSCYCKNAEFMKHVYGCISAWSGSNDNTTAAASYLM
ncbi:hypothetical protein LTR74_013452, partial [Friedmanniomyces endolithicus]